MKIAIIEDNKVCAEAIAYNLRKLHYHEIEIIYCHQYRNIVEELRNKKINFAIVDLEIGKDRFGGIKIVSDIKSKYPIPTLYYSGLPESEIAHAIQNRAADSFLRKIWLPKRISGEIYVNKLALEDQLNWGIQNAITQHQNDRSGFNKIHGSKEIWLLAVNRKFKKFYVNEIVFIKSYGDNVKIYLRDETVISYKAYTLTSFYKQHLIRDITFMHISRSYILNTDYIDTFKSNGKIALKYSLYPNEQIAFGRKQMKNFKERIA